MKKAERPLKGSFMSDEEYELHKLSDGQEPEEHDYAKGLKLTRLADEMENRLVHEEFAAAAKRRAEEIIPHEPIGSLTFQKFLVVAALLAALMALFGG